MIDESSPRSWTLLAFPESYCVARGGAEVAAPEDPREGFFSVTRTGDETSVVCVEGAAPEGWTVKHGWRILKVAGVLDFSEIGILASLSATLAAARVSIFALSTWDTDYLMVGEADFDSAVAALEAAGHDVRHV